MIEINTKVQWHGLQVLLPGRLWSLIPGVLYEGWNPSFWWVLLETAISGCDTHTPCVSAERIISNTHIKLLIISNIFILNSHFNIVYIHNHGVLITWTTFGQSELLCIDIA